MSLRWNIFIFLLVAVILFCGFIANHFYPGYDISKDCPVSVVTTTEPNYLAEVLWGYTTLRSVAKGSVKGRKVYLRNTAFQVLNDIMYDIECPVFEEKVSFNCRSKLIKNILPVDPFSYAFDTVKYAVLNFSLNPMGYFKLCHPAIRKIIVGFKFRKYIESHAKEIFDKTIQSVNISSKSNQIVCVWVSENEDFTNFKLKVPFRNSFFTYTMEVFRFLFKRPLFVIVGDVEWAKTHIFDDDVVFPVFIEAKYTLSIMSFCNHAIVDGSDLSIWGALKNPGKKYVLGVRFPSAQHDPPPKDFYFWPFNEPNFLVADNEEL